MSTSKFGWANKILKNIYNEKLKNIIKEKIIKIYFFIIWNLSLNFIIFYFYNNKI